MKTILLFLFAMSSSICVYAQLKNKEDIHIVNNFIKLIQTNDAKSLSKITMYPLKFVKNEQEFIKYYDTLFDEKFKFLIVNSDSVLNWSKMGWRGIMFKDGDLWLTEEGKLLGLNYNSKGVDGVYAKMTQIDKQDIHYSIRDYKNRMCVIRTTNKTTFRIDEINDGSYRLSMFLNNRSMKSSPDLILHKGECTYDGSGGNRYYTFLNGNEVYTCCLFPSGSSDNSEALISLKKNGIIITKLNGTIEDYDRTLFDRYKTILK